VSVWLGKNNNYWRLNEKSVAGELPLYNVVALFALEQDLFPQWVNVVLIRDFPSYLLEQVPFIPVEENNVYIEITRHIYYVQY